MGDGERDAGVALGFVTQRPHGIGDGPPSNLVDNAVKWSPPGEPIAISVAAADGKAHVQVRDRGPGIPAALRETVFERFYRAPEARSQPGAGLGLSIADYVARSHEGSASVIDTDGPGTTVELRFPLAADSESPSVDTA